MDHLNFTMVYSKLITTWFLPSVSILRWLIDKESPFLFTINFRFIIWVIIIEICKHRYNSNSHFMPFKFILSCELYYLFFCWLYDIIKIIVFIWNIPNILPVRLYGCISHCPHECVLAFINFLYLFCWDENIQGVDTF